MTSYTKQLRAGKGTIAALSRENLDPAAVPAETEMTPEAAAAVLAEPVAQEIEQDVLTPVEQIEQGTDALMEAEADAGLLENTAQILEDASGDGVADVDVATPELANITVERIAAKYGMARTAVLSKESLGAAASRVETTRFISKEAFEKAGELRKRVSEGVAKLIEWFKNLIKNIFDKRTKLEKRFQAIKADAKNKAGYTYSSTASILIDESVINIKDQDIKELLSGFDLIAEIAKDTTASIAGQTTGQSHDFNPKKIAGITLKATIDNGKLTVEKSKDQSTGSAQLEDTGHSGLPLALDVVEKLADHCLVGLANLKSVEAACNKVIAEMGSAPQKLKALATGKENGESAARANILARYQGVTTLAGTLSTVALSYWSTVCQVMERSLATYQKPAA